MWNIRSMFIFFMSMRCHGQQGCYCQFFPHFQIFVYQAKPKKQIYLNTSQRILYGCQKAQKISLIDGGGQKFQYYNYLKIEKQGKMVWYFNFCSPHLNDDSSVNLNRTLMVIEIVLAMLITFIVHMLAELYDQQSSRVKNQADPPEDQKEKLEQSGKQLNKTRAKVNDEKISNKQISVKGGAKMNQPGFFKNKRIFFLTVQTVQNKSPCFLGHFSIAVAACAMYSPFLMQTLLGLVYIVVSVMMLVFQAWKFERMLTISVAASYIINLALVTSAVVGVGLTNWDPFTINCYYSKLNM